MTKLSQINKYMDIATEIILNLDSDKRSKFTEHSVKRCGDLTEYGHKEIVINTHNNYSVSVRTNNQYYLVKYGSDKDGNLTLEYTVTEMIKGIIRGKSKKIKATEFLNLLNSILESVKGSRNTSNTQESEIKNSDTKVIEIQENFDSLNTDNTLNESENKDVESENNDKYLHENTFIGETRKYRMKTSENFYIYKKSQIKELIEDAVKRGILTKDTSNKSFDSYFFDNGEIQGTFSNLCGAFDNYHIRFYTKENGIKKVYYIRIQENGNKRVGYNYEFSCNSCIPLDKGWITLKRFKDVKNYIGSDYDNLLKKWFKTA